MKLDSVTRKLIGLALEEDLGRRGDITTRYFLPKRRLYSARLVFKEKGVLCGARVVDEVFRRTAPSARIAWKAADGRAVPKGGVVARIRGPREILTAERTALNFLQKLSGIATVTRAYVKRCRGTRAEIYDTRKTLPGWRSLSKYAVRTGGGKNHRQGLYDMAMVKDTHLETLKGKSGGFQAVVDWCRLKCKYPDAPLCMEARNAREVGLALSFGADIVMLDNMPPARLRREIRRIRQEGPPGTLIEISGGVALKDVGRLARMGADRISVGRITHSAPAIDISMQLEKA